MKMNVPSNTGSPSLHQDSSSDLVNKLTAAIQAGDEEKTEALVKQLCNLKVKLNISLEQEEQEQRCKENDFSVKVHIEDRVSKGCLIPLKVKACDTIGDLKKKMMLNYDFPPDVQRWIIGKKIPKDQDRLSQCGVKGPGHTLYLYLVTARSVGITREDYVYQKQNMLEGNNSNMAGLTAAAAVSIPCQGPAEMAEVPSPIQEPMQGNISSGFGSSFAMAPLFRSGSPVAQDVMARPEPNRQMSKQSVSSGSNRLQTMLESPTLSMNSGALPVNPQFDQGEGIAPVSPAGSTRSFSPAEIHSNSASTRRKSWTASVSPQAEPAPTQVGWACASCTYINLPARPGCEMCANTRPLDYQIPVDYVLTPEEIVLLEAEKRAEQTTREEAPRLPDNPHRPLHRLHQQQITRTQLQEDLRLVEAIQFEDVVDQSRGLGRGQVDYRQIGPTENTLWGNLQEIKVPTLVPQPPVVRLGPHGQPGARRPARPPPPNLKNQHLPLRKTQGFQESTDASDECSPSEEENSLA